MANRTCSIDGCEAPYLARGWCRRHYDTWWAWGDPFHRPPTPLERFVGKCDTDPLTGCWLWTGFVGPNGYARFKIDGTHDFAHRVSYELFVGPIPAGLQIDHLCRVKNCVNPAHLEAVTPRENQRRADTITARNAAKTSCPQGHPYDTANTYVRLSGGRACRACARIRAEDRRRQAREIGVRAEPE